MAAAQFQFPSPSPTSAENFRPTARQERALAALAAGRTNRAAASAANVSERTVFGWRRDPGFARALQAARDDAFQGALDAVRLGFAEAVESARKSLRSKDGRERVAAQRTLTAVGLKANDQIEVERRLSELESRLP